MLAENIIHQGDAIELMGQIADNSVDMILCDLPSGRTRCEWDQIIPMAPLWANYKRIIKLNGAIVLLAIQPFATDLINAAGRKWFRYDLIWAKSKPTGWLNANRMPLRYHESVLLFYHKLPVYDPQMGTGRAYVKRRSGNPSHYNEVPRTTTYAAAERYPSSVMHFVDVSSEFSPGTRQIHPSQKPLPLFEYLIRTYSKVDDLVLDNAIGSGTTAVAALQCNRRYMGIEIDEEYVRKARLRVRDFLAWGKRDPRQLIFDTEIMENANVKHR